MRLLWRKAGAECPGTWPEYLLGCADSWKEQSGCWRDEKEVIIISLDYGKTQGVAHKGKSAADISNIAADSPVWFKNSVEAALLAPTAVNQQKFRFERNGNLVTAKAGILGTNLKVDLGIVKCHFELGAGKENFSWA